MSRYDTILFDLDGTITDSAEGIINSVEYALKRYNITVTDRSELRKFIGPPLHESFEKYYGFSAEEAKQGVACYREYYARKGIYENRVYDGIESMLSKLKESGKTIILATSKPEKYAGEILKYFKLDDYFTYIAGSNLDGTRTRKDEVIEYALKACNITDYSNVVMIGDRKHDIIGAAMHSIDSIGVLYGYGSREELEGVKATYIINNTEEILTIIL